MANVPKGTAQYLTRFGTKTIPCNPYALAKLGIDRASCSFKIEDYLLICVPYQLGFKQSIFMASLSTQEIGFFQKYINHKGVLSISFNPEKKSKPVNFFIRCNINTIGQLKNRDNVGLLVLEMVTGPDEMIMFMGGFLENQERIAMQYGDYGNSIIRMTPETAKKMGYNHYATISGPGQQERRIQIFALTSKIIEHLEAAGAPSRALGSEVTYQIFFKKYRAFATGVINETATLPQGIVRTKSSLSLCPELVEIIDDYWYNARPMPA